ncbi:DUF317 domain-containing protein [Streptomyces sp. C8S0]|uniref:DUF317 domain-containing protein n=1 Tax=Streptomyces sp. C8S0 TaxID=2585716 RepID=UPI0021F6A9F3|nr:DUF317 domain-containing protein [Streptomyces sp. C8S0]
MAWHIGVRDSPDAFVPGPLLWHAFLDDATPEHLVTAFVSALADTTPLQRGMFDRTANHGVVQELSPLTPQQTVDAYLTRVKAVRSQARAARRQQTKSPCLRQGRRSRPTCSSPLNRQDPSSFPPLTAPTGLCFATSTAT